MAAHMGAINSMNTLISKVFTQPKGDLAGRLNSRMTVAILGVSAGLLLSTHLWGEPITCWTPAEFPKIWSDFVNQFCYVEGTYFSNLKNPLEYDDETRQRHFINYYQWVPYVLALQAFAFFMPRFVWNVLASFSGYDLTGCIQYVDGVWHKIKSANFAARVEILEKQAAVYVWDGIRLSRRHHRGRMVMYYVLYSVIQAANSILMFWWLNELIDSPLYSFSMPSVIVDLIQGRWWQKHTVNCVLTLNIYYEKLLLFLWFWMLFVCVVSLMSCASWVTTMCFPERSQHRLRAYLGVHAGSVYFDRFVKALGPDGVFIMHQLALNIGDLPASYLSIAMYNVVAQHSAAEGTEPLLPKGPKEV